MSENRKKQTSGSDLRQKMDHLSRMMSELAVEMENKRDYLTNEDIGELYVAYSQEDDGIYISGIKGDSEFEDGWTVSFHNFAKALWDRVDQECEKSLITGMRSIVESMERWQEELAPTE
jgi:hypothetical protein